MLIFGDYVQSAVFLTGLTALMLSCGDVYLLSVTGAVFAVLFSVLLRLFLSAVTG